MMDKLKRSFLVTAIACLLMCLAVGKAMAGTVKVQTSSGGGACATYYTESGDWATGDAMVSSNGSVGLATNGSVKMGLVRGGSGPGSGSFAPFTGKFSARTNSSGDASASSTDPRVDIFVVSQPGSSTVGNYTIDGNPGIPYTRFNTVGPDIGAVDAAGGENNGLPDWILVDQGTYNEQVVMNNDAGKPIYNGPFEANSALTSVWGADHTTIDAGGAGSTVAVEDIPGFRVEGFTVTGARYTAGPPENWGHGIYVEDSPSAVVTCNTATGNLSGIAVSESDNAQIRRNTVTQNVSGIAAVLNSNVEITENTVTQNISGIAAVLNANPRVTDNTVTENISGIAAVLNAVPVIAGNEVSQNVSGIAAVGNLLPVIARNEVTQNISGIAAVLNAVPVIAGNEVSQNVGGIAAVANYIPVIAGNTVTDNFSGIAVVGNNLLPILAPLPDNRAIVTGNTVSDNAWNGIWVRNSDDALIGGNTVTGNQRNGISLRNSDDAEILVNTVTGNEGNGIFLRNSNDASIGGNTVTGNQRNGISLRNSDRASIVVNTVTGNEGNGIFLRNSNDAHIGPDSVVFGLRNTISGNALSGIRLTNSDGARIRLNNITGNNVNNSPTHGGVSLVGDCDDARIRGNNIEGNSNAGVYNATGNAVNARDNWWGDGSGPTDPIGNPFGSGDAVLPTPGSSVDYTNWRTPGPYPLP